MLKFTGGGPAMHVTGRDPSKLMLECERGVPPAGESQCLVLVEVHRRLGLQRVHTTVIAALSALGTSTQQRPPHVPQSQH